MYLSVYAKEMKTNVHQEIYIIMFVVIVFIMDKNHNPSRQVKR